MSLLTAPIVTTTSMILSSNKIQNGYILVLLHLEDGHYNGARQSSEIIECFANVISDFVETT